MSLKGKLRKAKWIAKGLVSRNSRNYLLIGICSLERFEVAHGLISVSGWAYSSVPNLENPALEILNEGQVIFSKPLESRRSEFAISYMETPLASQSGFAAVLKYQSDHDLSARLHFVTKKGDYFFELGRVKKNVCHSIDAYVMDPWAEGQIGDVTAGSLQRKDTCEAPNPENNLKNAIEFLDPIDLIIPVYNGYDFLDPLFASIPKTNMKFRVIIVNDASPDERIAKKIDEFTSNGKFDSIVITNETNQGFPKAVNSGLEESTGHVVLLNTDIELPDMWLERMITPLLEDRSVASVTPFTNSGTICSFPKFIEDNPIIDQLSVNAVDAQFRKMNPMYTELPTGVGFCMAMSRDALNDIGFFDCESFGRGYGEENDWCQRAIEHGYKNVIAENVFVYHKHGGSFESEDKRRLCEENMSKLLNKHPHYLKDVADFCEMDPLFQFRNYVEASIKLSQIPEVTIAFNHLLGGGADSFLQKEKGRLTETGMPVAIVSYSTIENVFHLAVEGSSCDFQITSNSLSALLSLFPSPSKVLINELVSYPRSIEMLELITNYINNTECASVFYAHDYLPLCPTVNLLNGNDQYCKVPDNMTNCQKCYEDLGFSRIGFSETIKLYRKKWCHLLEACSTVVCFSKASEGIFKRVFPNLNYTVIPHETTPLRAVDTTRYMHDGLHIGILGLLTKHKGGDVVKSLIEKNNDPSVRFILIGSIEDKNLEGCIDCTGEYEKHHLPSTVEMREIDIFVLPSICPETFSFTCSEIIDMGLPLVVFDIGAPAEKAREYEKGLVVPLGIQTEDLLKAILDHANEFRRNRE